MEYGRKVLFFDILETQVPNTLSFRPHFKY